MRRSIFAIAVAFLLAATSVFSAQGGPKPKPASKPSASVQKPTTTTKVKPVSATSTTTAPKVQKSTGKSTTTRSAKATTAKSATKSAKAATKSETKTAKAQSKADAKTEKAGAKTEAKTAKADAKATKDQKSATTTATTTDATTPNAGDTPLTPVQEKLQRNTNLASKLEKKLEGRLPAGTDLMDAALGFKNLGQFVAAVNVSTNLQLDFIELKTRMVDRKMSLGQAIQDLKATASATVEAQRAEYDARVMIAASETEAAAAPATASEDRTVKGKKAKQSNKKAVGGAE